MHKMMTFFDIRHRGETLFQIPFLAFLLLLVCLFWLTVPLLIIGLIADLRYAFSRKEVVILEPQGTSTVPEFLAQLSGKE